MSGGFDAWIMESGTSDSSTPLVRSVRSMVDKTIHDFFEMLGNGEALRRNHA